MWRMMEKSDDGFGRFVSGDIAHCVHLIEHRVVPTAGMVAVRKRITGMVTAGK